MRWKKVERGFDDRFGRKHVRFRTTADLSFWGRLGMRILGWRLRKADALAPAAEGGEGADGD